MPTVKWPLPQWVRPQIHLGVKMYIDFYLQWTVSTVSTVSTGHQSGFHGIDLSPAARTKLRNDRSWRGASSEGWGWGGFLVHSWSPLTGQSNPWGASCPRPCWPQGGQAGRCGGVGRPAQEGFQAHRLLHDLQPWMRGGSRIHDGGFKKVPHLSVSRTKGSDGFWISGCRLPEDQFKVASQAGEGKYERGFYLETRTWTSEHYPGLKPFP